MIEITNLVATEYRCLVCRQTYFNESEAVACAEQPWAPIFKVGDIVEHAYATMGWIDNDDKWIAWIKKANPRAVSHFDRRHSYSIFYVVVAVLQHRERDYRHLPKFILVSDAYTGKNGWRVTEATQHTEGASSMQMGNWALSTRDTSAIRRVADKLVRAGIPPEMKDGI